MTLSFLRFEPFLQSPIWGGKRLRVYMGKDPGGQNIIGESWEISDVKEHSSKLSGGAAAGRTLSELSRDEADALMGKSSLADGRFPLLIKFIDAREMLSVQVHPDEAACVRLGNGARPKTEAWFIIDCAPGASLFVGLKDGVSRETLGAAIIAGTVERYLERVSVKPGDFIFLPSGTVHAIGEGILLAEVQQPSATTYRLFDWNRVDASGKSRELHVEQALVATQFDRTKLMTAGKPGSGRPGVTCPWFEMELVKPDAGASVALSGAGPLVLMGVGGDGAAVIRNKAEVTVLHKGETVLVPACLSENVTATAVGDTQLLAVRCPTLP